jgi:kynurenine formamidase
MFKLLSYPINERVPAWPGSPQLRIEKCSQISEGKPANTAMISLYNHIGTHYDAPNHFIPEGLKISELPLQRFIFQRPLLLDIPKTDREKITAQDLADQADRIACCDLLMLRTGFSRYRVSDPPRYEAEGPGISAECAEYLVARFKNLAAVAVDFVSIASYRDRQDGNRAHEILLGGRDGHFICALEDVNMGELPENGLKRVFALPLFVQGVDSAPVTVLAELDQFFPVKPSSARQ